jgi:hypothetical protein
MHRLTLVLLVSSFAVRAFAQASSQPVPTNDPQALAILQKAVAAMGGSAPVDSTATGTITTTSGSATDSGTFILLTRGTDQSSEQIQTSSVATTLVYSRGITAQIQGNTITAVPNESGVTAQSADFPLPLLLGMVSDTSAAFKYVGLETLNGISVYHVRLWRNYSATPTLTALSNFSVRDIWFDASSGLPLRISYNNHLGQGTMGSVAFDLRFANYNAVNGVQFPFLITKSVNGTPWATMTISNVVFNTGLTDANFPVN